MFDKLRDLSIVKESHQGKVRDIYDLGETLLIVTSDRISAFDVVFPEPIEGKGVILNQIAVHVFKTTGHIVPNHFISDDVGDYPKDFKPFKDYLAGRSMLVRKCRVIPFECIVRGYISGSAWKEYQKSGTIGGMMIAEELQESQKFSHPLFTPSTKATVGHDLNISYREMLDYMDKIIAEFLKQKSLELYNYAHEMLLPKGIVLADTKFEFGAIGGEICLIDEALTPDSSRFWDKNEYEVGKTPPSFDKQIVRDYLIKTGWDKKPPAPALPDEIKKHALERYRQIHDIILGES